MSSKILPNNVIRLPTSYDNFFIWWFKFLEPYHRLTPKEIELAAEFVKKHIELSKGITDPKLLDKVLMLEETKREIRESLNMKYPNFQVLLSNLRKNKVIENDKLNPRFIPNLKIDENDFKLLFLFQIKDVDKTDSSKSV